MASLVEEKEVSSTSVNKSRSNSSIVSTKQAGVNLWGQLGNLTTSQEEVFQKFTEKAKQSDVEVAKYSVETFDQCCLRFLRARQFDVEKALILLSECINKLIEMKAAHWSGLTPEECSNCDMAALQNFYPHVQCGFDKQNRPLLFEHTGGMTPHAILWMSSRKNLINYHWWSMETNLDQKFTEAAKRNIAEGGEGKGEGEIVNNISTCVVLDFKDLGLVHCSSKMMDQMKLYIGLDNTCYPETLGKMLVINAPYIAVQTWAFVKKWLDPRTQQKIEILSTSESMARLHEYVSLDQLPKMYGGSAPDLFYRKDNTELVTVPRNGKTTKTITVQAGKKLTVDSYINEGPLDISITVGSEVLSEKITVKPSDNKEDGPTRNLQTILQVEVSRQVTIIW
eukprot:CAMPEP_0119042264 /NCGR_PEP_ID=MMETSP1177-20130426/14498_1 /TAXON_ID=2985 /ORGANISM="Ochromonas sp, Strain CCMP1899" /LENGTH=394 /DNA_ID=CAMNT_0007008929 /DNA_START=104 /DNA_END=1285 /DNA_ORIENTATION=+